MNKTANTNLHKKSWTIITITLLLIVIVTNLRAQVNIGSKHSPAKGAILQIKDTEPDLATISATNNITAKRGGIIFPRASLLENDKLEPFLSNPTNNQKLLLTGLIVYNLSVLFDSKGKEFKKGLYLWDGNKWNEMVFLD